MALEAYRRELVSQGKLVELSRLVGLNRAEVLAVVDGLDLAPPEGGPPALTPGG